MHLDDPVNQNASHSLCNIWLILHIFEFWLVLTFCSHEVLENVTGEFGNVLGVLSLMNIAVFDTLYKMALNSLQKVLVDRPHFVIEIMLLIFLEFFYCWSCCAWALRFGSHMDDRNLRAISSLDTVANTGVYGTIWNYGWNAWARKICLSLVKVVVDVLFVVFLLVGWFMLKSLLLLGQTDAAWVHLKWLNSVGLGTVHWVWFLLLVSCSVVGNWKLLMRNQLLSLIYWSFLSSWWHISCALFLISLACLNDSCSCGVEELFLLFSSLIHKVDMLWIGSNVWVSIRDINWGRSLVVIWA